jgi:hypothetical protein
MAVRAEKFLTDSLLWFDTFARNVRLKEDILDLIRLDQLFNRGVDGNDEIIGTYSLATSFIDPSKGFGEPFTLKDTGDFYRSMFIVTFADSISIEGDTTKFEDQDWYRPAILQLDEKNLNKLRLAYEKNAISYAKRVLFGNFGMSNVRLA